MIVGISSLDRMDKEGYRQFVAGTIVEFPEERGVFDLQFD